MRISYESRNVVRMVEVYVYRVNHELLSELLSHIETAAINYLS